ncbi:phosphoribosylanthranilate isomerase [Candidatus Vidania fulgoroideorum]
MFLKYCGIKEKKDLFKCYNLKIKNIGFVFYEKSFRFFNIKKIESFKSIFFGVFVNSNINYIFYLIKKINIKIIQLHGNNNILFYNTIKKKLIVLFFSKNFYYNFLNIIIINSFFFKYLLIENINLKYGGVGLKNKKIFYNLINSYLFLSGGINFKNIKQFIEKKPYCLDISSGIEKKKKKKYYLMKKIKKILI